MDAWRIVDAFLGAADTHGYRAGLLARRFESHDADFSGYHGAR